jgi:hypothetical protein
LPLDGFGDPLVCGKDQLAYRLYDRLLGTVVFRHPGVDVTGYHPTLLVKPAAEGGALAIGTWPPGGHPCRILLDHLLAERQRGNGAPVNEGRPQMKAIAHWLHPSSWNALVVFLAAGVFGGLFAWNSYNLVVLFMANFRFISEHGLLALQLGAFRQMVGLVASLYLSIAFYVGFKVCEYELVARLRTPRGSGAAQSSPPADH